MAIKLKISVNKNTVSRVLETAVVGANVAARITEVGSAISESRRRMRTDNLHRHIEIGKAGAGIFGEFARALRS